MKWTYLSPQANTTRYLASLLPLAFCLIMVGCQKKEAKEQGDAEGESQETVALESLPGKPPTKDNLERLALILQRRTIDDVGQVRLGEKVAATLLSDGTGFKELGVLPERINTSDLAILRDLKHVVYKGENPALSIDEDPYETMLIRMNLETGKEEALIRGASYGMTWDAVIKKGEKGRKPFANGIAFADRKYTESEVIGYEYHPSSNSLIALNYNEVIYIDLNTGKRKKHFQPQFVSTRIGFSKTLVMVIDSLDKERSRFFNYYQEMGNSRFFYIDTGVAKVSQKVISVNADFTRLLVPWNAGYGDLEWKNFPPQQEALIDNHFKVIRFLPKFLVIGAVALSNNGDHLYYAANGVKSKQNHGGIWRIAIEDIPANQENLNILDLAPLSEKVMELINYDLGNFQIHPLEY